VGISEFSTVGVVVVVVDLAGRQVFDCCMFRELKMREGTRELKVVLLAQELVQCGNTKLSVMPMIFHRQGQHPSSFRAEFL